MTLNENIIKAFADQFSPPLSYGRTERINGVKVSNGWTCSFWDKANGLGFTVVVYEGRIQGFLEVSGSGNVVAEEAGKAFAAALGRLASNQNGVDNG